MLNYRTAKRALDILISSAALLILLPIGLVVCLILRFTGEGKVWYRQPRVGLHGRHFLVFKFVTMREGSEHVGNKDVTVRNDPRVLPVGRFLRNTKINELPQLLNVLLGDMSIVGWRPLVPNGFRCYPQYVQDNIVSMKPGLTGIGSVVFRDEEAILERSGKQLMDCYANDIAPYKGELELWYQRHCSLWLDIKIIFCTLWVIVAPRSRRYLKFFEGLPEAPAETLRDIRSNQSAHA